MKISDFERYSSLLKDQCGLILSPEESYLLDSRLLPVAKKWGYPTLPAMTMTLYGVPDPDLVKDIVEAMADTDSSFFRDLTPFEILSDFILPYYDKTRKKNKQLNIWSAGCAAGQEPYSIAMTIAENPEFTQGCRIGIDATDVSTSILEKADSGKFDQYEVQKGLPVTLLLKYFEPFDKKTWIAKPKIRKMVKFDYFNLLDSMDELPEYDVIFCRNVLSQFEDETQAYILENMIELLPDDGFILLGKDEKITGITDDLVEVIEYPGLFALRDGVYKFAKKVAV